MLDTENKHALHKHADDSTIQIKLQYGKTIQTTPKFSVGRNLWTGLNQIVYLVTIENARNL